MRALPLQTHTGGWQIPHPPAQTGQHSLPRAPQAKSPEFPSSQGGWCKEKGAKGCEQWASATCCPDTLHTRSVPSSDAQHHQAAGSTPCPAPSPNCLLEPGGRPASSSQASRVNHKEIENFTVCHQLIAEQTECSGYIGEDVSP